MRFIMNSIPTATSTGVSDLLQMVSTTPALSSLLSSSAMKTALQKSSPADVVQLSDQAMQLQEVNGLFGGPNPSQQGPLSDPMQYSNNPMQTSNALMQNLMTSIYLPSSVNLLA